jgi:hypothetical protein
MEYGPEGKVWFRERPAVAFYNRGKDLKVNVVE